MNDVTGKLRKFAETRKQLGGHPSGYDFLLEAADWIDQHRGTILAQAEEIERLRSAVLSAREALESLPEDALGDVPDSDSEQGWFIRDELIHRMTQALTPPKGEGE